MTPNEICAWIEIVFASFTEDEIEQLEIFAERYFDWVKRGVLIHLPPRLILDVLKDDEKGVDK